MLEFKSKTECIFGAYFLEAGTCVLHSFLQPKCQFLANNLSIPGGGVPYIYMVPVDKRGHALFAYWYAGCIEIGWWWKPCLSHRALVLRGLPEAPDAGIIRRPEWCAGKPSRL